MITREQMVEELNKGTCSVVFEKKDGTRRTMSCTLNSTILSEIFLRMSSTGTVLIFIPTLFKISQTFSI